MTKNELKTILSNHITNLENLKEELNDIDRNIELYVDLFNNLESYDYIEMYNNIDIIGLLISTLFEPNLSDKIADKLYNIVYKLQQIQTICGEDAFGEKEFEINVKVFESLKNFINQKYQNLKNRKEEIKKIYSSDKLIYTRRILSQLTYSQKINGFEISNLPYILTDANVSIENQIRIIEIIRKHNKLLANKIGNENLFRKTQVEMILDTEFDKFEDIYVENSDLKKEYNNIFELYKNFIDSIDNPEDIKEIIDKPSLEENPNIEKFKYIMTKLLNYYQSKMLEIKNIIYDEDCYCNEDFKKEIIQEFNIIRNKYRKIMYVYNTERLKLERQDILDTELPTVNNLFFAQTISGNVYVESDIMEIAKENLGKVSLLLNKLRTDTLAGSESKALIENKKFKGYKELRKDQIRIIYTHLSDNNYLIVGVGTKKTDNDLTLYKKMIDRNIKYDLSDFECSLNENDKVKIKIDNYIKENQRKGSR